MLARAVPQHKSRVFLLMVTRAGAPGAGQTSAETLFLPGAASARPGYDVFEMPQAGRTAAQPVRRLQRTTSEDGPISGAM